MKVIVDVPKWPNDCESTLEDTVQCHLETAFDSMVVDGLLSDYIDFTVKETDNEDWKTKYMYLAADTENYKKRLLNQKTTDIQQNIKRFALSLIEIIDEWQLLLNHESTEGAILLYDKFMKVLKDYNIENMNVKEGDTFNEELHEAVTITNVVDSTQNNMIMNILCDGYRMGNDIIRYPKVVVGKYIE